MATEQPSSSEIVKDKTQRQPVKLASSLKKLAKLKLSTEKIDILRNSIFSMLAQITHDKESSATLISQFSKLYDPDHKIFILNNNVSFRFCTQEVANVLGINNTGTDYVPPTSSKIPKFLSDLQSKKPKGNKITPADIVSHLESMPTSDEASRSNFRKLFSYFVIEQFLLCSTNPKCPRTSFWSIVEDLDAFAQVNWAKAIFENICEALTDIKSSGSAMDQQHTFKACAPVLEAIIYERVKPIQPKVLGKFSHSPLQKFGPQRMKDFDFGKVLETIEASQITPCQWCGNVVEAPMPESDPSRNLASSTSQTDFTKSYTQGQQTLTVETNPSPEPPKAPMPESDPSRNLASSTSQTDFTKSYTQGQQTLTVETNPSLEPPMDVQLEKPKTEKRRSLRIAEKKKK